MAGKPKNGKKTNGNGNGKKRKPNGLNRGKTVRKNGGRFASGTAAGPGRPSRAAEHHYQDLLRTAVSDEDWIAIVQCAVEEAKRGGKYGVRAREFVADRLLGRPRTPVEITDPESIKQQRLVLLRDAWKIKQVKRRAAAIASIVAVVGDDGMPTLDQVVGRA